MKLFKAILKSINKVQTLLILHAKLLKTTKPDTKMLPNTDLSSALLTFPQNTEKLRKSEKSYN
jgi:hypothetical protein